MFASIVGHAIFQTAGASGPSTMDRSYRRLSGAVDGAPAVAIGAVARLALMGVLIGVRGIYGGVQPAADAL
jgi:hypothetical protein